MFFLSFSAEMEAVEAAESSSLTTVTTEMVANTSNDINGDIKLVETISVSPSTASEATTTRLPMATSSEAVVEEVTLHDNVTSFNDAV